MDDLNTITDKIIGASIKVHKALGPGLLESVYETCLAYELNSQGLSIERQKPVKIHYSGLEFEEGFKIDLLVEDKVVVELKSVKLLEPIHEAQLLTYMRLAKKKVGLLINFNVIKLKNGIKRRIL